MNGWSASAETIARPHGIVDRPGARDLVVSHGEIRFDAIGFNYGSAKGLLGADPARVIDGLGRVSVVKRRHGLSRCRYKGPDGMERWVGFGVIGDNLINIGHVMEEAAEP